MADTPIFKSSLKKDHQLYRKRLWLADTLDLALGLLLGWAVVRYRDWGAHGGLAFLVIVAGWLVYGTLAGALAQTPFRWLIGIRLQRDGAAPGLIRAAARTVVLLPDHIALALFQARPFDRRLGLLPRKVEGLKARAIGLLWQLPWIAALALAVLTVITPTRSEALRYLNTLDGWRCCHGRLNETRRCVTSLRRLVADSSREDDAEVKALVGDCQEAGKALPR